MILIIISTLVAFISFYNSFLPKYNWIDNRISAYQNMYYWLVFPEEKQYEEVYLDTIKSYSSTPNIFTIDSFVSILNKNYFVGSEFKIKNSQYSRKYRIKFPDYVLDSGLIVNFTKIDKAEIDLLINSINVRSLSSRDELVNIIKEFNKVKIETTNLVRIPILGISFDINGIVLICSLYFTILLVLCYFCVEEECSSISNINYLIKRKDKYIYSILSSYQVLLFTKPINYDMCKSKGFINKVIEIIKGVFPVFAIIVPVILLLIFFVYDLYTMNYGYASSVPLTLINYVISGVALVILIVVCILCVIKWLELRSIYLDMYMKLNQSKK